MTLEFFYSLSLLTTEFCGYVNDFVERNLHVCNSAFSKYMKNFFISQVYNPISLMRQVNSEKINNIIY